VQAAGRADRDRGPVLPGRDIRARDAGTPQRIAGVLIRMAAGPVRVRRARGSHGTPFHPTKGGMRAGSGRAVPQVTVLSPRPSLPRGTDVNQAGACPDRAGLSLARAEGRGSVPRHRDCCQHCCQATGQGWQALTDLEHRPAQDQRWTVLDDVHFYGSVSSGACRGSGGGVPRPRRRRCLGARRPRGNCGRPTTTTGTGPTGVRRNPAIGRLNRW